ncbi:MAG: DUF805 domain-containing protein [Alphaproteobacteria bacterium]|nr:DUF805 domain-containing protein [Alphaproteobacteria bacterium]
MSPPSLPARSSPLAVVGGLYAPVSRQAYVATGAALMLLKYAMDAALLYGTTGALLSPLAYLLPSLQLRGLLAGGMPEWAQVLAVVWTLPFVWVGVSMSVRRARDAGLSGFAGLAFFIPLVNYLMMAMLAVLPSKSEGRGPALPLVREERSVASALTGVAAGSVLGLALTPALVFGAGAYGMALFFGTPFVMGVVAGWLHNLGERHGAGRTIAVGVLSVGITGGLLLLFGIEGLLCLAMAAPPAFVLGMLGALLGRELAAVRNRRALAGPLALLPVLGFAEPLAAPPVVRQVLSVVEVDAPPEAVWPVVIAFPDIPDDGLPWYFQAGIAWPQRARIEGEGVGAVRHCEFSTGAFVEPITAWEPPTRLAFDVIDNPHPMDELSPWQVEPPHLDGFLQSRRGEFQLIALPDGRTRLEGRTWYTVDMGPEWYWGAWSDAIIHRIHGRVLGHIATVAAAQSDTSTTAAPP